MPVLSLSVVCVNASPFSVCCMCKSRSFLCLLCACLSRFLKAWCPTTVSWLVPTPDLVCCMCKSRSFLCLLCVCLSRFLKAWCPTTVSWLVPTPDLVPTLAISCRNVVRRVGSSATPLSTPCCSWKKFRYCTCLMLASTLMQTIRHVCTYIQVTHTYINTHTHHMHLCTSHTHTHTHTHTYTHHITHIRTHTHTPQTHTPQTHISYYSLLLSVPQFVCLSFSVYTVVVLLRGFYK